MQSFWKQVEDNSSRTIRAVRIVFLVLIVVGITLLSTQKMWVSSLVNYILRYEGSTIPDQVLSTNSLVQPQKISSSTIACIGICEPFDFQKYFEGEIPFSSDQSYSDPSGKHTVALNPLADEARNIPVEIYVDGKLAGETGGRGILQTSFSPDGRYFAFLVQATMSCCEIWRGINVVDLSYPTVMELLVEPIASKENSKLFITPEPFIESYAWGGNNTIFVTGYPVGIRSIEQYYRINSKQIWGFNLTNPSLTTKDPITIKTLPE